VRRDTADSFFEASSMRKVGNTYYLVYASDKASRGAPQALHYATSDSPLGPFAVRGVLIDNREGGGGSNNVHGGFDLFNGKYYLVYHKSSRGNVYSRRLCIEPIVINPDGSIDQVYLTTQGPYGPLPATGRIEAEWAATLSGSLNPSPSAEGTERLGSIKNGNAASYKYIDFGDGVRSVTARVSSPLSGVVGQIEFRLDSPSGELIASVQVSGTGGWDSYSSFDAQITKDVTGVHALYLVFTSSNSGDFANLNWFAFEGALTGARIAESEGGVTATYTIRNENSSSLSAFCVLAVYDVSGRLKETRLETVTVGANGSGRAEIAIPFTNDAVKAFIWNADTYAPLCEGALAQIGDIALVSPAAEGYNGFICLSWEAGEGGGSYVVYRDGLEIGATDTAFFSDTDVEEGRQYVYTVKTVNPFGRESEASAAVTAAADSGKTKLPNIGWTASASVNSGSAYKAINGSHAISDNDRWTTGTNQNPNGSQWFVLDLGKAYPFNQLQINGNNDYPRGYEIYVSQDGSSWESPVASGQGTQGITVVGFARQKARYIRIVQTGSITGIWWSIYELEVYNDG
jgi:hypothetical protein